MTYYPPDVTTIAVANEVTRGISAVIRGTYPISDEDEDGVTVIVPEDHVNTVSLLHGMIILCHFAQIYIASSHSQ